MKLKPELGPNSVLSTGMPDTASEIELNTDWNTGISS